MNTETLLFNGEPACIQNILDAMEMGMALAKERIRVTPINIKIIYKNIDVMRN